ncbi:MAG: nucleotidyltransferase family protein [Phocaeicola sp.]
MKFAIIAAGEGSRLAQEGVLLPKPLVPLNGVKMIERLIRIFVRQGAEEVVVIVNQENQQTYNFLLELQKELPLQLVVKSTPSSMHSFYELSTLLGEGKFCLTTVDTIFLEEDFATFIEAFRHSDADGMMAVTDFIDDEKPLYIATDHELRIVGFYDETTPDTTYISGGIYCLTHKSLKTLKNCMESGVFRMRNYQRQLVADGLHLKAFPFSKIVDVDHAEDIGTAEAFLRSTAQNESPCK